MRLESLCGVRTACNSGALDIISNWSRTPGSLSRTPMSGLEAGRRSPSSSASSHSAEGQGHLLHRAGAALIGGRLRSSRFHDGCGRCADHLLRWPQHSSTANFGCIEDRENEARRHLGRPRRCQPNIRSPPRQQAPSGTPGTRATRARRSTTMPRWSRTSGSIISRSLSAPSRAARRATGS